MDAVFEEAPVQADGAPTPHVLPQRYVVTYYGTVSLGKKLHSNPTCITLFRGWTRVIIKEQLYHAFFCRLCGTTPPQYHPAPAMYVHDHYINRLVCKVPCKPVVHVIEDSDSSVEIIEKVTLTVMIHFWRCTIWVDVLDKDTNHVCIHTAIHPRHIMCYYGNS